MRLFNRSKFISGKEIDKFIIQIEASLVDTIHEMELSITVDFRDMVIIDARSSMLRVPYYHCHKVSDLVKNLIGLKVIKSGQAKSVAQLIGGKQGCLILEELSQDAIKAISQTGAFLIPPNQYEHIIDSYTHDTCYTHCLSIEEKKEAAYSRPMFGGYLQEAKNTHITKNGR
ncbi:Protein of unknown function [Desulfotomaculum arcticum]|uniref:DUF2889 domain-containing protein n=1 Tax=Desulfotruncus arcticus DSM 17038 TaxID=1121424 RepID=A0A1I2XLI2_9FIRM|nr:DUF2889 domain-containing protein [Desulfotruncus arcticus]SFH14310.1 Protein of unknown function [Desulfotomaculum arcticum] [Desulfotruncus arcticus DSM 17038]